MDRRSSAGRHQPLAALLNGPVLTLGVLLAALWVLWGAAESTEFHRDERRYLQRARFFSYLFVERDLSWRRWGDDEATHTQPMLANYIAGGWLWANGRDVKDLQVLIPQQRVPGEDRSTPRRYYPDMELLVEARRPMVVFSAGAIVLLYLLGRELAGRAAGLAAAGLTLFSPLGQEYLIQVRSEAPLTFFILLGLLLGIEAARRHRGGRLPFRWAAALGLVLGLGIATKLTAALSLGAVAGWGLLMAAQAVVPGPVAGLADRARLAWRAGRGWAFALSVAVGVFVASNPHLYPNPLLHTAHLVEHRADELERQQDERPAQAVETWRERPIRLLAGSLVEETWAGSRGLPLEAALAAVGLAVLSWRTCDRWRHERRLPPEAWVMLVTLAYYAGTSAGLSVVFRRYFIPTLVLGMLLSGVGFGVMARYTRRLAARSIEAGPCELKGSPR